MKVQAVPPRATDGPRARELTLVWIDAREAIVVRWSEGAAVVERIESDVPPHHRSTGHVRHDPGGCHGGGPPRAAGEPHRLEHLARFLDTVTDVLPDEDDLLLLGPGTVHEHLARLIRERDGLDRRERSIAAEPATRKPVGSSSRDCGVPVVRNPDDGLSALTAGAQHRLRRRLERSRSGREGSRRSAHRVRKANARWDDAVRILVATDGSPSAELGVDLVAGLDLPSGTSVRVIDAIETGSGLFGGPWPSLAVKTEAIESKLGQIAVDCVEQARARLGRPEVDVSAEVLRGRPATVIVDAARNWRADVIVVGSRGHGTIESMLLGSVSAEVIDHAPVPVLVARGDAVGGSFSPGMDRPVPAPLPISFARCRSSPGLPFAS